MSTTTHHANGLAFSDALMREVKERFLHVDRDHHGRERLYFDNAGGSFRLKAAAERFMLIDAIPDNAERIHATAVELQQIQAKATEDLRTILNARGGSVYASLTASGAMFDMVRAVAENVPGTNMVTTVLEHPSSFDAMSLYAGKSGRGLGLDLLQLEGGGVDALRVVGNGVDLHEALGRRLQPERAARIVEVEAFAPVVVVVDVKKALFHLAHQRVGKRQSSGMVSGCRHAQTPLLFGFL